MEVELTDGHRWLERLVGEWTFEVDADMGPDQPREEMTGTASTRSLGGAWIVSDWRSATEKGASQSVMTVGYAPATKRYIGTFVTSAMTHMWVYDGVVEGDALVLDAEGPSITGDAGSSTYRDRIQPRGADELVLTSAVREAGGGWREFMTMTFRRVR